MPQLVISAKHLGDFAVERACPRCLWVGLHVKPLPYQTFPGIFSSIANYNELVVEAYFQREKSLPQWLSSLGEVESCLSPPSYHRFFAVDPSTGAMLRGTADAIFRMKDGSCTIVDYKTARHTPGQDALFPVYQAQLNGYAYIADRVDLGPVSQLALVYMEPVTDPGTASSPGVVDDRGFTLGLSATVVPVKLHSEEFIPGLLRRAQELNGLPRPPEPAPRCKECKAAEAFFAALH